MRIFNKAVWSVVGVFFLLLFIVSLVAQPFMHTWSNQLNYVLGIDPYKQVGKTDVMYYKSDYIEVDENGNYDYNDLDMREHSMDSAQAANEESAVLLWNDNNALPLKKGSRISFFGAGSAKQNWIHTGSSSSVVNINRDDFDDLKQEFERRKFGVNGVLWDFYATTKTRSTPVPVENHGAYIGGETWVDSDPYGKNKDYKELDVVEMPWTNVYNAPGVADSLERYGDAAIMVIQRQGMESGDTWFKRSSCIDDNYLNISYDERGVLEGLVKLRDDGVIKKIILVLNTGAQMSMKDILPLGLDACIYVGYGGNAPYAALCNLLRGSVNPSGHLVDTYAYDTESAPSVANTGPYLYADGYNSAIPADNRECNTINHAYLVYQEGIYVGYRYYETRYEDYVLNDPNVGEYNYGTTVAFPFGHGESYTSFEYSDFSVEKAVSDDEIGYNVSVTVTNTGKYKGKDVVQVYLQKPYTDYDKNPEHLVEKSAVDLVGYFKTDVLEAAGRDGSSQTVTVFVPEYEFKSYDAYGNGTYILEPGSYYLAVGTDAHDALNNILALKNADPKRMSGTGNASFASRVGEDITDADILKYSTAPATDNKVVNRFDNADILLYDGAVGMTDNFEYISRNDWAGTMPVKTVKLCPTSDIFARDMNYYSQIEEDENAVMPIYGADNDVNLAKLVGKDYDDPMWESLLDKLTFEETVNLCGVGAHAIQGVVSVDSPSVVAQDGTVGIRSELGKNTPAAHHGGEVDTFMSFPCASLVACSWNDDVANDVMQAYGMELMHSGIAQVYGTGAGIHRSAHGGRNFEYLSEDGFISGKMLRAQVEGLMTRGIITTIKHFALNDQEIYRCGVTTWANEQSIREIYLKAFEEAVTKGRANGLMSSMNRIGTTWTGRHEGLLTGVLRNEWDFVGIVETDFGYNYYMGMSSTRASGVVAGNDLWMNGDRSDGLLWTGFEDNATVCQALRKSAHNILYTVAHSFVMNGMGEDTRIVYVTPWYFGALLAAQITLGIVTAVCIGMAVTSFVLLKKGITEEVEYSLGKKKISEDKK